MQSKLLKRPNLLFITCHDLGRHLGCYGQTTVHSPHLDTLAHQGVRFSRAFCVAPQCSPSRASMTTGLYPSSHGVIGLTHGDFAWQLKDPAWHLASVLRQAGWHTALAGGQHETSTLADLRFDDVLGDGGFASSADVADACARYLQHARDGTQPFYLQVGFFEPHRDFDFGGAVPDQTRGVAIPPFLRSDEPTRNELAAFQGAIRQVDAAIGRVLASLDAAGLADDTLVIFAADHGIPFPRAKCSLYDPGMEIALLIRWPRAGWGMAGRTVPILVSNVDIVPTLYDLLEIPAPRPLEGISFRPALAAPGPAVPGRDRVFGAMTYHDYYDPQRCIRTETHKLIVNFSNAPAFMDPSQQWHRVTTPVYPAQPPMAFHPLVELYDLIDDPLEQRNLHGTAGHATIADRLKAELLAWMEQTSDPLLVGVPPSPRHHHAIASLRKSARPTS